MPELIPDLRAQREARGWSVTELARRSATSDLTIRTIENGGACTPEAAERIRAVLDGQEPLALSTSLPIPETAGPEPADAQFPPVTIPDVPVPGITIDIEGPPTETLNQEVPDAPDA